MLDNLVPIAVWIAVVLTGLALLAVAVFGIRSALYGKLRLVSIISIAIPAVLVLILYFVFGTWAEAAVAATMAMVALALITLVFAGLRGAIS